MKEKINDSFLFNKKAIEIYYDNQLVISLTLNDILQSIEKN